MRGTTTGLPLGASVSLVSVLPSLATAPRSPATSSVICTCSLPRSANKPCKRSSADVRELIRWRSGLIVPEITLKSET